MRALKAFLLGALAVGIVAYALAAALAVAAQAGGPHARHRARPARRSSRSPSTGRTTVTTFGPGLLLLAFAGGLANLAAAQLIRHRAERQSDRVD